MPNLPDQQRPHTFVRPFMALAVLLFVGSALLASGCGQQQCAVKGDPEALIGGAYTAIDHNGVDVSSDAFLGQYQLVFFGFTSCPDVCPTALVNISAALDDLGDDAAHFQTLFVSIDPERDTPDVLAEYLSNFHPSLIGLTGSAAQIKDLAHVYRAYYARGTSAEPGDADYTMDHSSIIYLMDCEGRYIKHFDHNTNVEALTRALNEMI
jgi:cytochrome oxidase Cu insertion factor (SCO1/SenC/PrrC family)